MTASRNIIMTTKRRRQGEMGGHQRLRLSVAGLAVALTMVFAPAASADPFAFQAPPTISLSSSQAGAHPDLTTSFELATSGADVMPNGNMKDVTVDLPAGLIGNPSALGRCTLDQIHGSGCPAGAQIGVLTTKFRFPGGSEIPLPTPVWNMVPRRGRPAEFVAQVLGMDQYFSVSVRSDGDYGIRTSLEKLQEAFPLGGADVTFWGVPADHNASGQARVPFLTNPAQCDASVAATIVVTSWQGESVKAELPLGQLTGCEKLPSLDAGLTAGPTITAAGQPAGYKIGLSIRQVALPDAPATPPVKDVDITLPAGTAISPSASDGLQTCSDEQVGLHSLADPACPDASTVGSVKIVTPLLDDPLEGKVYIGTPKAGDRFRLLLVAQGSGVTIKLVGSVKPDPVTGQLVTSFKDNPALPFSSLNVHLDGGSRAVLANPSSCGTYTATATLTPYGGGAPESPTSDFDISSDGAGGACPNPRPFAPTLDAGTTNALAGQASPFVFHLARTDADRELGAITTVLPAGLLGNLGMVPLCGDAAAAAGTCDASTEVGQARVASGPGSTPFWLGGHVYLTGPYKGAPFGLSIVVPAIAGPYDLGTVVVRAAINVDRDDAHLTVVSDPLPTILEGVPLRLRDIVLNLDRPGFMFNPTSCAERQISASVTSTDGTSSSVSRRFQAVGCGALGFQPRLAMDLATNGPLADAKHPRLTATVSPRAGDANLSKVVVKLPEGLAVDLANAKSLCTSAQDAAHACPDASIVGNATAKSILHQPLAGPVYFVENRSTDPKTGKVTAGLPKLSVALRGEGVSVDLHASTLVEMGTGRIQTTFADIPDVPISAFKLQINGGAKGILMTTGGGICAKDQALNAQLEGQNGKLEQLDELASTTCGLQVVARGWSPKAVSLRVGGVHRGRLTVSSPGMVNSVSRTVSGDSSTATVAAKLSGKARAALRRDGKVRIRVTVTLRPSAGGAVKRIRTTVTVTKKSRSLPALVPDGTFH